jgi:hypothetical protein
MYFKGSEKEIIDVILMFIGFRIPGLSNFFYFIFTIDSNTFPKLIPKIFFSKHFLL